MIKYYYILSCTGSMFESGGLLKRNRIIWPEVAVNSQFLVGKSKFSVKSPKKSKFFGNLPWKINIFCEITSKNQNFSEMCPEKSIVCEIARKNRNFSKSLLENQIFWEIA